MEKIICVLLVIVIVLMLKNMYLPSKPKKHRRKSKMEENSFSMKNVNLKDLVMPGNVALHGKKDETKLLPKGYLEVITKNGSTNVPVVFNKNGQFLIGSSKDCGLVLNSPYIGAHHCSIEIDEESGEIVLFDNDSRNGIYDGTGKQVDEVVMAEGTDFYLAKCVHLRWCEYNAFTQVPKEELPNLSNLNHTKKESDKDQTLVADKTLVKA